MGRAIGETIVTAAGSCKLGPLNIGANDVANAMGTSRCGYAVGFYLFVLTYLVNLAAWSVIAAAILG